MRGVRAGVDYELRPGDVLYAIPRRPEIALIYGVTTLLHAALVITNALLTEAHRIRDTDLVMDAVNSGDYPGVHRKPLRVFHQQYRTKWHAWMPDLSPQERMHLVGIAEQWDGVARWHPYWYKNPEKRYFHCLGFVEYCYEEIGRDVCDDGPVSIIRRQPRAFRQDRYAYQRKP